MFCNKCGTRVGDTDSFCPQCGNNLKLQIQKMNTVAPAAPQAAQPVQPNVQEPVTQPMEEKAEQTIQNFQNMETQPAQPFQPAQPAPQYQPQQNFQPAPQYQPQQNFQSAPQYQPFQPVQPQPVQPQPVQPQPVQPQPVQPQPVQPQPVQPQQQYRPAPNQYPYQNNQQPVYPPYQPPMTAPREENVLLGILGALIGALIGGACIVLLNQIGYVASLSGLVLAFCTLMGYEKLGGKLSTAGIIISVTLMLVTPFFANWISWAITFSKIMPFYSFSQAFADLHSMISLYSGAMEEYVKSLLMVYGFTALGAVGMVINTVKKNKN